MERTIALLAFLSFIVDLGPNAFTNLSLKNMKTSSLVQLLIPLALAGGPTITTANANRKGNHLARDQTSFGFLNLNTYPNDTTTSELCLKRHSVGGGSSGSALSPCPLDNSTTPNQAYLYTIGTFNATANQFYIKSLANGKCKLLIYF